MRYIKVLLLAIVFFLSLVFFFQNQGPLSQDMVLTLNLFFIPPMKSIALPFYFLVLAGFVVGALLTLCLLVWDKVNLSARLMKYKWRISSLERETESLKKKLGAETARTGLFRKAAKKDEQAPAQLSPAESKPVQTAEEALVPDPDKP